MSSGESTKPKLQPATIWRRISAWGPLLFFIFLLFASQFGGHRITYEKPDGYYAFAIWHGRFSALYYYEGYNLPWKTPGFRYDADISVAEQVRLFPDFEAENKVGANGFIRNYYQVPIYWFVIISITWLIFLVVWRKRIDTYLTCPQCGYDLRGCPDATECPECGAAIPHAANEHP